MLSSRQSIIRTCKALRNDQDKPVQSDLALTPAQMADLAEKGIPISTANAQLAYEDGTRSATFDIPIEERRGIDIADVWNTQQDARDKVVNAYQQAKKESIYLSKFADDGSQHSPRSSDPSDE